MMVNAQCKSIRMNIMKYLGSNVVCLVVASQ